MNREKLSVLYRQSLRRQSYFWADYPSCLQISTSNLCSSLTGVMCDYCYPQHRIACKADTEDQLSLAEIEWILADIGRYGKHLSFYTLFLDNDGLADDRLPEILRAGKRLAPGKRNQTFTCGTLTDRAGMLCDSNLDWVCFTVSAPNAMIYRQVYHADKFDSVIRSMRYVDEHRLSNQALEVHYVITEKNIAGMRAWWDFMGREFPCWKRVFSPLVSSYDNVWSNRAMGALSMQVQVDAIRAVDYEARFWDPLTTSLNQPCVLWNNASVNAHGFLLQCCNWADYTQHNYGNIRDFMAEGRSIRDYWMERLANKQRNNLCRNCNLRRPDYKKRLDAMSVNVRLRV